MAGNSFGTLFRFTTFGESHGPQIGCVVDGVPAGLRLSEADIQPDLDRRKPGTSKFVTQRRESDEVSIVSGVFEGFTTGSPVGLIIHNGDQRSKDYGQIRDQFRPGHADFTYWHKYGLRDYRGGGRSSARETAMRVAAGAIARVILRDLPPKPVIVRGALITMGGHGLDRTRWDWSQVAENPFFCPDSKAAILWAEILETMIEQGVIRKNVDGRLLRLIGLGALNWVATWFDPNGAHSLDAIGDLIWQIAMDGVINKGVQA